MIGWRNVFITAVQFAIVGSLMGGCESDKGQGGGVTSKTYQCHNPEISVDVATVTPIDVYVCDHHANKVIWNGNTNVNKFTITFAKWFSGAALTIDSKTTGCGHNIPVCAETPEVPAHQEFTVLKYTIVITPNSGVANTLDPHVVSGGGIAFARE